MKTLHVIDSHTGGEPTRLVIEGFPALTGATLAAQREELRTHHDRWRKACLLEPRGNDVLVGALLCPPVSPGASCGVIFFNNTGYLGMCGHGTIGLVASLHHLGRLEPGEHLIDTPVGPVTATLHGSGEVTLGNVPAWRYRSQVEVQVPGYGRFIGDIAWGGNWFFLVNDHGEDLALSNVERLTDLTWNMLTALQAQGIHGEGGEPIDHIELFADDPQADSRNFVMCPGKAYDRSPCGTGTSAKLACLAADGKLAPGQPWVQAGITGSRFTGHYQAGNEQTAQRIRPFITGQAWVTADARLLIDDSDPFAWGI
ncbi:MULTISPECIES: 4-hydroxyproline epimerase [unclassified Pseudomonas]|uniref:4-hydroxyproline epimerase n=1 Tax=unclassified Pseudomonas TaxID=196821 RepID=UPI000BD1A0CA|nr:MULTISPECIES: 4-hydroxyproline epimerase [unclassified Pseudomonas]PVZ12306.1 4-hydroxyproline epimerase [Pseudomonas sp. URIL14HWK12:I12]PVZ23542.1 4-hydroxyproline epimerase [Pseudomonas sp. URIL14HWK12:I10]PVZ32872.1 4-hydroxyproline epimerase [Pseudomonas sp. URIL14HWK12:I11]SNZ18740.1 4-hydroxyproline epimerase [Pseudomonas sp. URIL14HWK12:I9]